MEGRELFFVFVVEREWHCVVSRKSPHLPGVGYQDGMPHQVLDNELEGHESHGAPLSQGVIVYLSHLYSCEPRVIPILTTNESFPPRSRPIILTGWPKGEPITASKSGLMHAAMTITRTNPRIPIQ